MGRGAEGVRGAQAGRVADSGGTDRVEPGAAVALQMSEAGGARIAAAHRDREEPQERTARQGKSKGTGMNLRVGREGPVAAWRSRQRRPGLLRRACASGCFVRRRWWR